VPWLYLSFLYILGKLLRSPDVLLLRTLVSTAEENYKPRSSIAIVDAVPRAETDSQFEDAADDALYVSWIPSRQPQDTCNDLRSSCSIPQVEQPVLEQLRLPYFRQRQTSTAQV
jgi:hypothetical protein